MDLLGQNSIVIREVSVIGFIVYDSILNPCYHLL